MGMKDKNLEKGLTVLCWKVVRIEQNKQQHSNRSFQGSERFCSLGVVIIAAGRGRRPGAGGKAVAPDRGRRQRRDASAELPAGRGLAPARSDSKGCSVFPKVTANSGWWRGFLMLAVAEKSESAGGKNALSPAVSAGRRAGGTRAELRRKGAGEATRLSASHHATAPGLRDEETKPH